MKNEKFSPKINKLLIFGLILVIFTLTACNLTQQPLQPTVDSNSIATAAAQTIEAILVQTEDAELEQATEAVQPTATLEPTMTPTTGPTETPLPTNTPTLTFTPTLTSTPLATNTPVFTATPSIGVLLSTYKLGNGESVTVSIYGFPKNAAIDITLKKVGDAGGVVKDGTTDANGKASTTLVLPATAVKGDKWWVIVNTTELVQEISAKSATITVKDPGANAKVVLSSTSIAAGGSFTVTVTGFPVNAEIDFQLGKLGEAYSVVSDGKTDSTGAAAITMKIPGTAVKNEKWVVTVLTQNLVNGATKTSPTITITDGSTSSDPKVTVSSTSLKAGDTFTVTVTGFPANADIDFQLGKEGQAYSVVNDGKTDSTGAAAITMKIPGTAVKNEKWVVTVLTTELTNMVKKTSPVITIIQ